MPPKRNVRSKKRSTKRTKSKSSMTLHQIFYNIGKGELKEIPRFYNCYQNNKKKCLSQGITYKLWTRKMVEKLLEKPENRQFKRIYYEFEQDIMRIDFARYLILYRLGGIYVDLDICMLGKSIKHLFQKNYFFVRWSDSHLPYNAILGTKKNNPLYLEILKHCEESYDEKKKNKIYKTWKGRFVFQTTGHFMLQRVLRKHKIKDFLDIIRIKTKDGRVVQGSNPLFEDTSASVWFDKK
jgi:mannosyltransferase OCH1-like enzyme